MKVAKKRGRKKKEDESYIKDAYKKIQEIEEEYESAKLAKLSAAEKKKIRNKKTAMQSRIKEKVMKIHLS